MPAPNLTPLPGKPVRGEDPEDFSAKMNAFLGALGGFEGEMNTVINWLNTINQFVEKALGDHASDPTERNDSSPLQAGDWYFNTTSKDVRIYTGTVWKTAVDTYTVSEVQSLLAGKLGKTEIAANTALFDGMASNEYSKFLFKTANTANTANQWSKVARVTLESQYHSHDVVMQILSVGDGDGDVYEEEVVFSVKQQNAFGSNPGVFLKQLRSHLTTFQFGYKIVQNSPSTIVDLYVKNEATHRMCYAFSKAIGSPENAEYFSEESLTTVQPSGLVNAARLINWHSGNDGGASDLDAGLFNGKREDNFFTGNMGDVVVDFNNYLIDGGYRVQNADNKLNYPVGCYPWGVLKVTQFAGENYVIQEYYPHQNGMCFRRVSWNGIFTPWYEFWGSINNQASFTVNGYEKLASGKIEQWGTITLSASHTWVSYNYPIAFPNGVLNLSLTEKTVSTTGDDHMHAIQENPSNLKGSFQVRTTVDRTNTYFWRAIGY